MLMYLYYFALFLLFCDGLFLFVLYGLFEGVRTNNYNIVIIVLYKKNDVPEENLEGRFFNVKNSRNTNTQYYNVIIVKYFFPTSIQKKIWMNENIWIYTLIHYTPFFFNTFTP